MTEQTKTSEEILREALEYLAKSQDFPEVMAYNASIALEKADKAAENRQAVVSRDEFLVAHADYLAEKRKNEQFLEEFGKACKAELELLEEGLVEKIGELTFEEFQIAEVNKYYRAVGVEWALMTAKLLLNKEMK